MVRVRSALVACSLACTAGSGWATVQASASITDLTFTLVDLTPDDGIDASFTLWSAPGAASVYAGLAGHTPINEYISFELNQSSSYSMSSPGGSNVQVSIGAQSISISGLSTGHESTGDTRAGFGGEVITSFWEPGFGVTLSANASLSITANFEVSASAFDPAACPGGDGSYFVERGASFSCAGDWAQAMAAMNVGYTKTADGQSVLGPDNRLYAYASAKPAYSYRTYGFTAEYPFGADHRVDVAATGPALKTAQQAFSTLLTNNSELAMNADVSMYVQADGSAGVAPIPEPGTYALFMIGLGALGAAVRRHRQHLNQA